MLKGFGGVHAADEPSGKQQRWSERRRTEPRTAARRADVIGGPGDMAQSLIGERSCIACAEVASPGSATVMGGKGDRPLGYKDFWRGRSQIMITRGVGGSQSRARKSGYRE